MNEQSSIFPKVQITQQGRTEKMVETNNQTVKSLLSSNVQHVSYIDEIIKWKIYGNLKI